MTNDAFLLTEDFLLDPPSHALMAEDQFCPRRITFTIAGKVGVQAIATERDGQIDLVVHVLGSAKNIAADPHDLFMHSDKSKLGTLQIAGENGLITEKLTNANGVIDLGQGANLHGKLRRAQALLQGADPGATPQG